MAIVATEVENVIGTAQRMIFYRCQDSQGVWHSYGPVNTSDANFNVDGFKSVVAAKMAETLAEAEFSEALRS